MVAFCAAAAKICENGMEQAVEVFLAAQILADCSEPRSHEVAGTVLYYDFAEPASIER